MFLRKKYTLILHLRCVIFDRTFKAEAGKFVETSKSKLKTASFTHSLSNAEALGLNVGSDAVL